MARISFYIVFSRIVFNKQSWAISHTLRKGCSLKKEREKEHQGIRSLRSEKIIYSSFDSIGSIPELPPVSCKDIKARETSSERSGRSSGKWCTNCDSGSVSWYHRYWAEMQRGSLVAEDEHSRGAVGPRVWSLRTKRKVSQACATSLATHSMARLPMATSSNRYRGSIRCRSLSHKYMIVVHHLHSKWSEVSCNISVTSGTITNFSPGGDYQKLSLLKIDPDSHLSSSLNSYAVKGSNIALRLSTTLKATVVSNGSTGPWRRESRHPWQKENRSPKRFKPHSATIMLLNMHSQEHLQWSWWWAESLSYRWIIWSPSNSSTCGCPLEVEYVVTKQKALKSYADIKWKSKLPKFDVGHWVTVKNQFPVTSWCPS